MNWERDDEDFSNWILVESTPEKKDDFDEWWKEFANGPIGSRPFPSKIVTG